ncbi:hypothetical protein LOC71_18060 [Rhodopirellula sp. JC740]|uniref:Uncharacterized protein n=1 Tax=Rhodopirellula halodulae TaxID=2894198 RepID=A0ABS8NKX4_9BACT|nr:hypothetical protein [Rhodopirellula sp. JC740]MCC9644190.1 hypothetical protein [Rhodopirellula sp. JC740]
MKIQAKKWILAASVISTVAGSTIEAEACGGARRGGISRVVSQLHSSRSANRYRTPSPRYSTHQYSQPHHYAQPAPTYRSAPVGVPATSIAPQTVQGQFAPQAVSQPVAQPQTFAAQTPQQRVAQPQVSASQPVAAQSQQVATQRQAAPQQAVSQQPVSQPVAAQPAATQAAANQPAATNPAASAKDSALAMLASINQRTAQPAQATPVAQTPANTQIPSFGSATSASSVQPAAQPHVGSWSVTLPGNQSVALKLNSDGSFVWAASKDGSTSQFSGQYVLNNGSLTLVRSNDLQKMVGTWTATQSGFVFQVGGGTNGGLNFTRS